VVAAPLLAQGISEDEMRWGSRPYFPQPPNAIRVESNLVQVGVVVRDAKGKAVSGLQKSDFQLYDNGRQVEISSFSFENSPPAPTQRSTSPQIVNAGQPPTPPPAPPTPRYIALFFDDFSMSMPDTLFARKAAESFVKTSLKPGDKIGIFTTSTLVSLNFTDNVPKLLEALGKLVSHERKPAAALCPRYDAYLSYLIDQDDRDALSFGMSVALLQCPELRGLPRDMLANIVTTTARETLSLSDYSGQDTLGILRDVIRYLGKAQGKRMLVLASSGSWTRSYEAQLKLDKLIGAALDANVIVNSLEARGLVFKWFDPEGVPLPPGPLDAKATTYANATAFAMDDMMALVAAGTGGRFYHNRNDLDVGLREMAAAPTVSYMLAFAPVDLKRNGATHSLKVKLANSRGLSIEARKGYLAPSLVPTDTEKKEQKLDNAVFATVEQSGVPAHVTTEVGASTTGEAVLKVGIHVNAAELPFRVLGERKVERLIFVTALFDEQNRFLTGVEGVMDLRLKKESLATLSSQGLDAKLSLQAPPGNYKLRQVIEEVGDGRITALTRAVTIH
jgi:VWFA-related protein